VLRGIVALIVLLVAPMPLSAQSSLPDPRVSPGAINPAVSQSTIATTICVPGWTRSVRPPYDYTRQLKRALMEAAGYPDRHLSHYELDHVIPLDLGGAPADPRNLWLQPRNPPDGWTALKKDRLEAALAQRVCADRLPLDTARAAIARNWHEAYEAAFGSGFTQEGAGKEPVMRAQAPAQAPEITPAAGAAPATPTALTCPGDQIVWVNQRSGVYHFQGQNWFAHTRHGQLMCRRDADRAGYRPTRNGE
jgi:hypothetical protein